MQEVGSQLAQTLLCPLWLHMLKMLATCLSAVQKDTWLHWIFNLKDQQDSCTITLERYCNWWTSN